MKAKTSTYGGAETNQSGNQTTQTKPVIKHGKVQPANITFALWWYCQQKMNVGQAGPVTCTTCCKRREFSFVRRTQGSIGNSVHPNLRAMFRYGLEREVGGMGSQAVLRAEGLDSGNHSLLPTCRGAVSKTKSLQCGVNPVRREQGGCYLLSFALLPAGEERIICLHGDPQPGVSAAILHYDWSQVQCLNELRAMGAHRFFSSKNKIARNNAGKAAKILLLAVHKTLCHFLRFLLC